MIDCFEMPDCDRLHRGSAEADGQGTENKVSKR